MVTCWYSHLQVTLHISIAGISVSRRVIITQYQKLHTLILVASLK